MFKNLIVYRIAEGWDFSFSQMQEALSRQAFVPCAATQERSGGWVPPRNEEHAPLLESVDGQWLMRFQTESKILPAAVVNKRALERAARIESQAGRKPGKKEVRDLRDEARLDLLPQAFTRQSGTDVWLDKKAGLFMVGAGTQARADELSSALVQACAGLSLHLLQTRTSPQTAMAHWLTQQDAPQGFALGDECELKAVDESRAVVRYARHSLEIDEIRQHIAQGKLPVKMALHWQDRVHFVLTEGLQFKKIAFEDSVSEHLHEDDHGFDADALIATRELAQLMADLLVALDE